MRLMRGYLLAGLLTASGMVGQQSQFQGSVPTGTVSAAPLALTLHDAIDRGLKANLGLLVAASTSDLSRGQRLQALSALMPEAHALIVSRLEDPLPGGPFDLVASALAVHHMAPAEKRRLFGRIREVLSPGGRFVLADLIVPINPADVTIELTPGFDRPDTLSDLIVWLAEVGLEVSVSWTHQDLAVLAGRLPA